MNDDHTDALPASTPKVIVHPAADRRLAATHWLLSTLPAAGRDRARAEWEDTGVAFLPLGTLFSAVRIPGRLLRARALRVLRPDDLHRARRVRRDRQRNGPEQESPDRAVAVRLVGAEGRAGAGPAVPPMLIVAATDGTPRSFRMNSM